MHTHGGVNSFSDTAANKNGDRLSINYRLLLFDRWWPSNQPPPSAVGFHPKIHTQKLRKNGMALERGGPAHSHLCSHLFELSMTE